MSISDSLPFLSFPPMQLEPTSRVPKLNSARELESNIPTVNSARESESNVPNPINASSITTNPSPIDPKRFTLVSSVPNPTFQVDYLLETIEEEVEEEGRIFDSVETQNLASTNRRRKPQHKWQSHELRNLVRGFEIEKLKAQQIKRKYFHECPDVNNRTISSRYYKLPAEQKKYYLDELLKDQKKNAEYRMEASGQ